MLGARILTGVIAVPILVAVAVNDGWLFVLGLLTAALLGTGEALWMVRRAGYRPLSPFSLLLAVAILLEAISAAWPSLNAALGLLGGLPATITRPAIGLVVLGSLAVLLVRTEQRGSLADWALTLALPLYVAGLLQFFVPLRFRTHAGQLTWPLMVLLTSWACDMAAFFSGRAIGRLRLAPMISPGKTVEGAMFGLVAAVAVGGLFAFTTGIDLLRMAGFGLSVGLGSIVGDLAESWLKRQCGVKDSGFIMPGHGGILDRMDALIFAAGSAHFYLQAVLP